MKTWKKPEIETLGVEMTMQGKHVSTYYDETRVDQNGNYWVSFSSGDDSKPNVDGPIFVPNTEQ